MSGHEYSQGIMGDGAAILKDGQPMTAEEIVSTLTTAQTECEAQLAMVAGLVEALEGCVAVFGLFGSSGGPAATKARAALSAYREKHAKLGVGAF